MGFCAFFYLHDTVVTHACTLTTSRSLLNIKVVGQRSQSCAFFCVLDTAASCGEYLAVSKA